ncbi:hypothetical protein LNV23_00300 [Paucibacter sp. DJ1R-11]|uniref:hypothetical protein n=1 Tax=Paucibacter sp. DJ1R-11 TaxID=2893556 RepID=UPI0021E3692B|nr:hypothetical protein [Paucibacter sp. DJ1R-11]MCV2361883.1 hypothetical protein [Paucibacter sp. DJ1R-11]
MAMTTKARTVLRRLAWGVGGLCLGLILLVLAWLAGNNRWVDAEAQPRPAALQPRPVALAPEANVFFDLTGLFAGPQAQPSRVGQALWGTPMPEQATVTDSHLMPQPRDAGWSCSWELNDCLSLWQQDKEGLRLRLAEQALLLERCAALADGLSAGRLGLMELLQQRREDVRQAGDQYLNLPSAPHLQGARVCARGFQLQAAWAQSEGQAEALLQALGRAQALSLAMLQGSQSLISNVLAWNQERQRLRLLAGLLALEPGFAPALSAQLKPLPERARDAGAWMPAESFFGAQTMQEMAQLCGRSEGGQLLEQAGLIDRGLCHFGFMPQRTEQANDAWWLQQHEAAKAGPEALLSHMQAQQAREFSMWHLPWRNTIGAILLVVAHPAFADYPAKQADLMLDHRVAQLAWAMATQKLPPSERAAWLARQDLTPSQRERITLSEDGLSLRVLPWAKPVTPSPGGLSRSWPLPPL